MKLELVVMPFFPLKHEALCEAQARLILKQVVELVEQFKRVNADGQCTGYIVPATVIAQLRAAAEGK
jgi:hypothetical protein